MVEIYVSKQPGRWRCPKDFYGSWSELERIEVGPDAANCYDETSSLMHRFIRAVGGEYRTSHNYWTQDVWVLSCNVMSTSVTTP